MRIYENKRQFIKFNNRIMESAKLNGHYIYKLSKYVPIHIHFTTNQALFDNINSISAINAVDQLKYDYIEVNSDLISSFYYWTEIKKINGDNTNLDNLTLFSATEILSYYYKQFPDCYFEENYKVLLNTGSKLFLNPEIDDNNTIVILVKYRTEELVNGDAAGLVFINDEGVVRRTYEVNVGNSIIGSNVDATEENYFPTYEAGIESSRDWYVDGKRLSLDLKLTEKKLYFAKQSLSYPNYVDNSTEPEEPDEPKVWKIGFYNMNNTDIIATKTPKLIDNVYKFEAKDDPYYNYTDYIITRAKSLEEEFKPLEELEFELNEEVNLYCHSEEKPPESIKDVELIDSSGKFISSDSRITVPTNFKPTGSINYNTGITFEETTNNNGVIIINNNTDAKLTITIGTYLSIANGTNLPKSVNAYNEYILKITQKYIHWGGHSDTEIRETSGTPISFIQSGRAISRNDFTITIDPNSEKQITINIQSFDIPSSTAYNPVEYGINSFYIS